ncbi:MAG: BrnT family toxin [Rubricoccaceae bacterium]|nr:BrnT family toxin [Rubricoccaceae bacterium]
MLSFEWGERKNRANQKKHGISFEEAQSAFFDEQALQYDDPEHSGDEDRFLLLGHSLTLRVLVVCHCFRASGSVIRIISARRATSRERAVYRNRGK